jgi:type IV secretory pathway VirJ component
MKLIRLAAILCVFAGGLALAPSARADEWNHQTRVTFSQSVEIPGMVLPPGTYVFKLMDAQVDRNIVQISNEDGNHVFATILAIPDHRLLPAGKTVIMFDEREADAPQAVRAWFYPGENYGATFVYPQPRAATLAKAVNQPVPSMPATDKAPEMAELQQAPVMTQQPGGEQTKPEPAPPRAQPEMPARPQASTEPQDQTAVQQPQEQTAVQQPQEQTAMEQPRQLPQTASDLPLIEILGFLSLALAVALRLVRRQATR